MGENPLDHHRIFDADDDLTVPWQVSMLMPNTRFRRSTHVMVPGVRQTPGFGRVLPKDSPASTSAFCVMGISSPDSGPPLAALHEAEPDPEKTLMPHITSSKKAERGMSRDSRSLNASDCSECRERVENNWVNMAILQSERWALTAV